MLFSVIVPIHNVKLFIHKCIDSVLSQNFDDYEVLLVDDGSTDGSADICDEYSQKDIRVSVIHKENGGLSDARNAGINISQGEYIFFLDSDDEIPLNSI